MSAFPGSHVDLLDRPLLAVRTTEMPDGRFQSTVVWFNRDGGHIDDRPQPEHLTERISHDQRHHRAQMHERPQEGRR